jgi:hypothetical protein
MKTIISWPKPHTPVYLFCWFLPMDSATNSLDTRMEGGFSFSQHDISAAAITSSSTADNN